MRFLPLLLLLGALGACGAAPTIVPEERPTQVTFRDYRTQTDLALVNEAQTSAVDFYSQARDNATTKVVPNLDMGALMMQLEDFGFFDQATLGARRVPGARTILVVERDGQSYSLALTREGDVGRQNLANNCNGAFLMVYNNHRSMQLIENDDGRALFEDQNRNLQNRLRASQLNIGR